MRWSCCWHKWLLERRRNRGVMKLRRLELCWCPLRLACCQTSLSHWCIHIITWRSSRLLCSWYSCAITTRSSWWNAAGRRLSRWINSRFLLLLWLWLLLITDRSVTDKPIIWTSSTTGAGRKWRRRKRRRRPLRRWHFVVFVDLCLSSLLSFSSFVCVRERRGVGVHWLDSLTIRLLYSMYR